MSLNVLHPSNEISGLSGNIFTGPVDLHFSSLS